MSDVVYPYADGTYFFEEPGVYEFKDGVAYKIKAEDAPTGMVCKHCGQPVMFTGAKAKGYATDYTHTNHILRCNPKDSRQPYGLEADYEQAEIKKEPSLPKGSKRPCAHPTCGFWVMFSDAGWVHIDTYGADLSSHLPKPLLSKHDKEVIQ